MFACSTLSWNMEGLQADTDIVPQVQLSEITLRYIKCHQDILSIQLTEENFLNGPG